MSSIKASKDALRKEIGARIQQLGNEEKTLQSNKVVQKLFALPAFRNSNRISVYLSTENEINTENIVREIFALNKKCYVPRYNRQVMEMVRLNDMKDWENLPLTKWKIKQPLLSERRENATDTGGLDLIIIPGVAFTRDGKRLGHGAGYYQ
ncbi:5-formyltetrahydrofolate cyclo-ligase family [Popillia japonica]|uniref:5-formyltetrahydrofolate cyclo-ligase n=1 Tax=Popillia japonica TaxID=7064 RepID=A0AAW1KGR5_POPJA